MEANRFRNQSRNCNASWSSLEHPAGRTKLPESLWQAAVELARQHGVYPQSPIARHGWPRGVDALELLPDAGAAWSMMKPAWPKGSSAAMQPKMLRAGLYARDIDQMICWSRIWSLMVMGVQERFRPLLNAAWTGANYQ